MATTSPRPAIYWHPEQQVPVIPGTLITLVALPHAIRVYHRKHSPINLLVIIQWLLFFTGDLAMWVGIFFADTTVPDPLYQFRKVHFLATECGTVVMTVCGLFKMRVFRALYPRVPERLPLVLAAVTIAIFIMSASDYIYGIAVGHLTPFIVLRTLPFVWALALDTVVSASLVATVVSIDFQFTAAAAAAASPGVDPAIHETDTGAIQIHVTVSEPALNDQPGDPAADGMHPRSGNLTKSDLPTAASAASRSTLPLAPSSGTMATAPRHATLPLAASGASDRAVAVLPPPRSPPWLRRAGSQWRAMHAWSRRIICTQSLAVIIAVTVQIAFLALAGTPAVANASASVVRAYSALGMVFLHSTILLATRTRTGRGRRKGTKRAGGGGGGGGGTVALGSIGRELEKGGRGGDGGPASSNGATTASLPSMELLRNPEALTGGDGD